MAGRESSGGVASSFGVEQEGSYRYWHFRTEPAIRRYGVCGNANKTKLEDG